MQMIRWGIVGLGTIAKKFADTVTAMGKDRAVLAAAASRDINKAKAFAEKYGIENSFGSYGELFESDCVDAVYICTPNSMHYKNCMAALENGKHVLCEKPFAINADEPIRKLKMDWRKYRKCNLEIYRSSMRFLSLRLMKP